MQHQKINTNLFGSFRFEEDSLSSSGRVCKCDNIINNIKRIADLFKV